MNIFIIASIVGILISCGGGPVIPPRMLLMEKLVAEMRDPSSQKSISQVDLTKAYALQQMWSRAEEIARSIANYRSALARLTLVEAKIELGQFAEASKDLLVMPSLPMHGEGQQRWEIISRQLSLAEVVNIYPEMIAAYEKANIRVPPQFKGNGKNLPANQFPTAAQVDRKLASAKKMDSDVKVKKKSNSKDLSSKSGAVNFEAPEGGEILLARMKVKMALQVLMARAEGLIALERNEDARNLLLPMLTSQDDSSFPNLRLQGEYYILCWKAGLQDQVRPLLPPLFERLRAFPSQHSDLGDYLAAGIVLATLDGKPEAARQMLEYGREGLRHHSDFSRNKNFAGLGKGCWESKMEKEARECWERSLQGASVIPNPQSRAVGAFEVLLAQLRVGAPTLPKEEKQIRDILQKLPEAYLAIGVK